MTRPILTALALLALAAGTARAAEPTLGGSLGASDRVVRVQSQATVSVWVDLSVTEGWTVEVPSFELTPGKARTVAVTTRGPDPGVVTATLTPARPIAGMETTALVLSTALAPIPRGPLADLGMTLLVSLGLGLLLLTATAVLARKVYRRASRHSTP